MKQSTKNTNIHNWVNDNRELLWPYRGMWVAHTQNEILASAAKGLDLLATIDKNKFPEYTIVYVYPTWFSKPVRFLPIRFKTLKKHEWTPNYSVKIVGASEHLTVELLVDSGADMCLIPKWFGTTLGLTLSMGEVQQEAIGIGGSVTYVMRNLTYIIDDIKIENVPTAWVQNEEVSDFILGREIIFDVFDIEFKQAEETIIFKKRTAGNDV